MRLKSDIPFNDVIDASFENIGTVFQIFTGFKDDSVITKEQMTESLIMGVIKTCIANLFIFFFTEINYWIRFRNPLLNIFSNGIRLPFYALAGFAMAGALINIIDIFILGELKFACSALVAILCFLLHLKGMKKKLKNFMMSKIFGFMIKNIIFSVINSIFVWIICTELDGLYDESKTMALVIACFIFAFILLAEDWILFRSPFKKR
ncbi:MAG: hypothetical protein IJY18_04370 [Clostridia bacterium]|nr:hypothetical protein [Clostridia bacterium]